MRFRLQFITLLFATLLGAFLLWKSYLPETPTYYKPLYVGPKPDPWFTGSFGNEEYPPLPPPPGPAFTHYAELNLILNPEGEIYWHRLNRFKGYFCGDGPPRDPGAYGWDSTLTLETLHRIKLEDESLRELIFAEPEPYSVAIKAMSQAKYGEWVELLNTVQRIQVQRYLTAPVSPKEDSLLAILRR